MADSSNLYREILQGGYYFYKLKGNSFVKAQRDSYGITTILTAAACEWFLILMLLINSILSYLATKFARYCDLQLPCILCSGFHHVLGNKKKREQFYLDVLCSHHRSELSHLISCQIHGNLADGRDMCDDCLLSFINKNKSNVDKQRVILGKLELEGCELKNDFMNLPLAGVSCLCCDKPWMSKTNVQKSFQLPPSGNQVTTKPNIPVPRRLGRRESLRRIRDKISGLTTPRQHPKKGEISGPTTTPLHSAKEEILGSTISRHPEKKGYESMSHVGYTQLKLNSDSESEFPFSDDDDDPGNVNETPSKTQQEVIKPRNLKPLAHEISIEHAESELNRQQKGKNDSPLPLPELISLDDIHSLSNVEETPIEVSPHNANYSRLSELISLVNTPPKSDLREEAPNSASSAISVNDIKNVQITKHEEFLDSLGLAAEAVTKINQVVSDQTPADHELSVDEIDALAQGGQLSASNNTSPEEQNRDDDLQTTGRFSVDVTRSINTESGDEAIVDQLKQQIEHDQICMNELYKELEEERNAAEIAANEAMAMITRLQEEKAALHMDALQYLRMMEEQAEYDVDTLEKANDLLAEKEKEIQDLETELDYYRLRYPEESDTVPGVNFDFKEKSVVTEVTLPSLNDSSEKTVNEISKGNDKPEVLSVWSELEGEKLYISKHLKQLEKKIRKFTREGASPDISDSEDSENGQIRSRGRENGSSLDKGLVVPNGIHPVSEKSKCSIDDHENSNHGGEGEILALENEISDLNERLEALEGDFNFLEHSFNSVQSGNKGLKFLEEIAHQLQGLRKAVVRTKRQFTS